jgi:hypothetical protein
MYCTTVSATKTSRDGALTAQCRHHCKNQPEKQSCKLMNSFSLPKSCPKTGTLHFPVYSSNVVLPFISASKYLKCFDGGTFSSSLSFISDNPYDKL